MLLLDSRHGVYIPELFAQMLTPDGYGNGSFLVGDTGFSIEVSEENYNDLLEGPEGEYYWESWESVLDTTLFDQDGEAHFLYEDTDLFLLESELDIE